MMDRKEKLALYNDWANLDVLENLFSAWVTNSMEPFHALMADYDLVDGPLAYWY